MGDKAPVYAQGQKLSDFALGKWLYTSTQGGSWKEGKAGQERGDDTVEFMGAGAFTFIKGGFKMGGSYTDNGQTLHLDFKTLNDKPMQSEMAAIQKRAEGGTQGAIKEELFADWATQNLNKVSDVRLGDDGKTLAFGPPVQMPATGNADLDAMASQLMVQGLVRLGKSPAP